MNLKMRVLLVIFLSFVGCSTERELYSDIPISPDIPDVSAEVVTQNARSFGSTHQLSGVINSLGSGSFISRGICWGTNAEPIKMQDNFIEDSIAEPGEFSFDIDDFSSNSYFYFRAYCITSIGIQYGNTETLSTFEYIPMLTPTTSWSVEVFSSSGGHWNNDIIPTGDTLINNVVYKKFSECCVALREDISEKRVYIRHFSATEESLLYNFNLPNGYVKTMGPSDNQYDIVLNITTIPVTNGYRRKFTWYTDPGDGPYIVGSPYVESVGGTGHPFGFPPSTLSMESLCTSFLNGSPVYRASLNYGAPIWYCD